MIITYCIKNNSNKIVDISNIVKEGMKLKKTISEFTWSLDFSITKNPQFYNVEIGDIIVLKFSDKEIFSGIIINGDMTNLSFKAVDYAWYFSKNEDIYQFEDIEASIVIRKLIETFGANAGNIEVSNTMVDNFYFGKTLGDIIKEIIKNIKELENQEFRFFYKETKFHFERSKKNQYKRGGYTPLTSLSSILNGYKCNALNYIKEPKRTMDIENMRNSIKVYKTSGKECIQVDSAKDNKNIEKYGLMQKLVSYKDNDLNAGSTTLSQENKINEKIAIEIPLLSEFVRDGELLRLDYSKYGISGVFEIISITYNFSKNKSIFTASLELEKVE